MNNQRSTFNVDRLEQPGPRRRVEISRKHRPAWWIGVSQRPVGIPTTQDLLRVHLDAAVTVDVENKLEKKDDPSRVLLGVNQQTTTTRLLMTINKFA